MRERSHLAAGTAAALAAAPWLRCLSIPLWLGAALTDVDLYAYYVVRHRRLSPWAAVRYYTSLAGRRERTRKLLHHPLVPLLALLAGRRYPAAGAFGAGIALHQLMDRWGKRRFGRLYQTLRQRSTGLCELCGGAQAAVDLMEPYFFGRQGEGNLNPARWRLICRPCSAALHRETGAL